MQPLIDALEHTALTVVELKGVNHVLRDDPTDSIANLAKQAPISPQLVTALDGFVTQVALICRDDLRARTKGIAHD